jgi:hypothetical protein
MRTPDTGFRRPIAPGLACAAAPFCAIGRKWEPEEERRSPKLLKALRLRGRANPDLWGLPPKIYILLCHYVARAALSRYFPLPPSRQDAEARDLICRPGAFADVADFRRRK